ncbi:MAG: cadherin-like beta sandwich domain-containing protein [Saccharofermentanales bacterium]
MKSKMAFLLALLIAVLTIPSTVSAAAASASLTGPGTVRAGDSITLTFKANGTGLYGWSGTLAYDTNQLTLNSTTQKIASPWVVEFNGNNFVAYDNNLSTPINSSKDLFTVTFKVKSVAVGTKIAVSFKEVKASDGNVDSNIGTITYSATTAAPLSGNASLASLTVSNAAISPAFSKSTATYTAEVPFSVVKLDISAAAEDSKAKVSISNPSLIPGGTTNVTVTVTAENGAKNTYTIQVKRLQDPDYKASSNAALSSLTVEGYVLSPVFNAEETSYVVWLPYETASVEVKATAADIKASGVEIIGGADLLAGQDNEIKVVCTAENGDKKEYVIVAKRAASHDGSIDAKPTPTEPAVDSEPSVTSEPDSSTADQTPDSSGTPFWLTALLIVIAAGAGFGGGFYLNGKLRQDKP